MSKNASKWFLGRETTPYLGEYNHQDCAIVHATSWKDDKNIPHLTEFIRDRFGITRRVFQSVSIDVPFWTF
jgi:hypothetical protein